MPGVTPPAQEGYNQSMFERRKDGSMPFFGHKPECWLDFLVCPRRYLAVLPTQVRPNLFSGD